MAHTSVYIPDAMLREIMAEAERQDRTVAWLLKRAWLHAKDRIRAMPGVDDRVFAPLVDLTSTDTFQIMGRGTVKTIKRDSIPAGVEIHVGDRLRVDGEEVVLTGIETARPPMDTIGILVRQPREGDK